MTKAISIKLIKVVGAFAENKDKARDIRIKLIVPALEKQKEVVLDFDDIEGSTQSFIHALISELIRSYGAEVLNRIAFKNCNDTVRKIIEIVVDYMQQSDN